jgi:hypothetical protein
MKYVSGKDFNPESKIDIHNIKKLVEEWTPDSQKKAAQTVEAFDPNAQLK